MHHGSLHSSPSFSDILMSHASLNLSFDLRPVALATLPNETRVNRKVSCLSPRLHARPIAAWREESSTFLLQTTGPTEAAQDTSTLDGSVRD